MTVRKLIEAKAVAEVTEELAMKLREAVYALGVPGGTELMDCSEDLIGHVRIIRTELERLIKEV